MNEFKTYHPIVNFIYFVLVIGFSMTLMHPLSLVISLFCAIAYSLLIKGKKDALLKLYSIFPMIIGTSIINALFNHEGVTILFYLPSENPITAESIIFGSAASLMILGVIFHFSSYNAIMTSDKFIYLFGKIIPSLSLIFSMVLRFIPKFIDRFREIVNTQKCIGRDIGKGSLISRLKTAMKIFSILVTWSLESSIEVSDSMKNRGYGLPKRTAYSIFRFCTRDFKVLLWMIILSSFVLYGKMSGILYWRYFPSFSFGWNSFGVLLVNGAYFLLCMTPVIIELWEDYKWKSIK